MRARAIGEIIAKLQPRMVRIGRLQSVIDRYPLATDRKRVVTIAYELEAITAADAADLIAINQLETA